MLGNSEQASYFYQYLKTQLQQADEENLAVKEAKNWGSSSKSRIAAKKIRDNWFWPYYLPFQSTDGAQTKQKENNGTETKQNEKYEAEAKQNEKNKAEAKQKEKYGAETKENEHQPYSSSPL